MYNTLWASELIRKIPKLLLEFASVLSLAVIVLILTNFGIETNDVIAILGLFGLAAVRILPSLNRMFHAFQSPNHEVLATCPQDTCHHQKAQRATSITIYITSTPAHTHAENSPPGIWPHPLHCNFSPACGRSHTLSPNSPKIRPTLVVPIEHLM